MSGIRAAYALSGTELGSGAGSWHVDGRQVTCPLVPRVPYTPCAVLTWRIVRDRALRCISARKVLCLPPRGRFCAPCCRSWLQGCQTRTLCAGAAGFARAHCAG
eukprot:2341257-Rhodomonas_salina.2